MSYSGEPDAPDCPPPLTVDELVLQGHARRVSWTAGKRQQTAVEISTEGHRLLGENQRERAARNRAWRESR